MIGNKKIKKGQIESYTTADVADSVGKRYQTENQNTFNDATSSIQTQLNAKQTYLVKDSVPTSAVTGTTSLTQIGSSILIPANTFSANDYFSVDSFAVLKTGVAGTCNFRLYINSTNDFATSTHLSSSNMTAAILSANTERVFEINGGNLKNRIPATASSFTDKTTSTLAGLSTPFNPTIDNYLFTAVLLSNATDSVIRTQLVTTK